jgi:hypothetical protein
MAPHVGQMDRVGAKLRSHTGQFIGFAVTSLRTVKNYEAKMLEKLSDNIKIYFN